MMTSTRTKLTQHGPSAIVLYSAHSHSLAFLYNSSYANVLLLGNFGFYVSNRLPITKKVKAVIPGIGEVSIISPSKSTKAAGGYAHSIMIKWTYIYPYEYMNI